MEYHSVEKKEKEERISNTSMNLNEIMLSEEKKANLKKIHTAWFHLYTFVK